MPPNGESVKDAAFRGVEALQTIIAERDKLLAQNDRLLSETALQREKIHQLEARLATAELHRDHYLCFSTEVVTKLNDVQMIIEDAIRNAKLVAFKPPAVPKPAEPQPPSIDTNGIEKLIARLPVNGGQDASKS